MTIRERSQAERMRQSLWPRSLTRTAQPGSPGSGLSFLKAGPGEPRHDCRRTSPGLWRSCRKKYNRWGSLYLLKIIVHPEGPSQPRDPEKPATRADSRSRGVLGVARAARESLQQRAMAPCLRENLLFWEWICSLPSCRQTSHQSGRFCKGGPASATATLSSAGTSEAGQSVGGDSHHFP